MRKLSIGLIVALIGAVAYYATFTAFYDSWFPYYYEDYFSYFFLGGLLVLLLSPSLVALFTNYESELPRFPNQFFSRYYRAVIHVNLVVVLLCVFTFIYMLSNGIYLGSDGPRTYSVDPIK